MGYFESIYSSDLNVRARAVYMYLRDRADNQGQCWPGVKTIARDLDISQSTVYRALNDLCKAGFLSKEHRWRDNGGQTSNLYKIL